MIHLNIEYKINKKILKLKLKMLVQQILNKTSKKMF